MSGLDRFSPSALAADPALADALSEELTDRIAAAADPDAEMAAAVEELRALGHPLVAWSDPDPDRRGHPAPEPPAPRLAVGWFLDEETSERVAFAGFEPVARCPSCGGPLFPHDALRVEIAASPRPVQVTLRLPHRTPSTVDLGAKSDWFELPVQSCGRCGGFFVPSPEVQRG